MTKYSCRGVTMIRRLGWLVSFSVLAAILAFGGCGKASDPWETVAGPKDGKKVLVSFPPLYCFAKSVAGDNAKVLCLLSNAGPHDYEPSSYDALKARGADLILINGLDLDGFISKIVNSSGNRKAPLVKVAEK